MILIVCGPVVAGEMVIAVHSSVLMMTMVVPRPAIEKEKEGGHGTMVSVVGAAAVQMDVPGSDVAHVCRGSAVEGLNKVGAECVVVLCARHTNSQDARIGYVEDESVIEDGKNVGDMGRRVGRLAVDLQVQC